MSNNMGVIHYGIIAGRKIANTSSNKGTFGEMIVNSIFDPRYFGNEERYIINNVYFVDERNKSHQIDHIVIYKTGIFCIETKNIQGLILGHDNVDKWAVYLNGKSRNMLNPIIQNKTHVKVLKEFLNKQYDIHPIIVFIKSNKPKDVSSFVLNLEELRDYIKEYKTTYYLSSDEMKELYWLLKNHKENTNVSLKEHVDSISK